MSLADQKLDTMPAGQPARGFGVDSAGLPVLFSTWRVLAQSSVALSAPADTNENTLVTVAIPAGVMGANGRVRVTSLWSMTNSSNNKTTRVRFDGVAFGSVTHTTVASYREVREVCNRNSVSSQIGTMPGGVGGWSTTTGALVTSTANTSGSVNVTLTAQKASAGETVTLESYLVEVLYAS